MIKLIDITEQNKNTTRDLLNATRVQHIALTAKSLWIWLDNEKVFCVSIDCTESQHKLRVQIGEPYEND